MKRTGIFIIMIITAFIQAFAYHLVYSYDDEANTCTITEVLHSNDETADVKIPETTISPNNATKVYKVTAIGENAFSVWSGLRSVTIPSSVTSIGDVAFQLCRNLKSVKIPNSVTHIGGLAFRDCSALSSIHIPNSVTEMGPNPFVGCPYINIQVDEDNPNFFVDNRVLYTKDGHELISYISGLANMQFEIPESVSIIGAYSFYDCKNLTEIILPSGLNQIEDNAFEGCESLAKIEVPNSVENIGMGVWGRCTNLEKVSLPDNLTKIPNGLFYSCQNLSDIIIPQSVDSIGYNAFCNCINLVSIQLPEELNYIGESAFYRCSSLTSIYINSEKIEKSSFSNCSKLNEITFGQNVKTIGSSAFEDCIGLKIVNIPDSVRSIYNFAFSGCVELTELNLGCGVEYIGPAAFSNCTKLQKLTIKDGTKELELANYSYQSGSSPSRKVGSFFNCPIEQLYLGRNLKYPSQSIEGTSPFYENKNLTRVIIGDSVSTIGPRLFEKCISLNYVKLGKCLTGIGGCAFEDCTNLSNVEVFSIDNLFKLNSNYPLLQHVQYLYVDGQEVTEIIVPDWVSGISSYLFRGWQGLKRIDIGNSVKNIEPDAFESCTALESIVIESNVETIGSRAFSNCINLKSFVIKDANSVLNVGDNVLYNAPIEFVYMGRNILGDVPFNNHSSLSELVIGDSVTTLGDDLFEGCTNLKKVSLGKSLSSIGYSAFKDCNALSNIIIPSSVKEIKDYAFNGCNGLVNVTFSSIEDLCGIKFGGGTANPLSVAHHLIIDGEEITDIKIPETVVAIGDYTFYGFSSLSNVEIPNSVLLWMHRTLNFGNSCFNHQHRRFSIR